MANAYQLTIYFHKTRDIDLITLANQVGIKAFKKIIKYSLRSLLDPNAAKSAKDLIQTENFVPVSHPESMQVRICISNTDDELIRKLLEHCMARTKGLFIKQLVRYTIGPNILLPLYLNQEFVLKTQTYTQLVVAAETHKVTYRKSTTTRRRKKEENIPKIEKEEPAIPTITETNTPIESVQDISNPETIYTNVSNTQTTSEDDAEEILSLLTNMLG